MLEGFMTVKEASDFLGRSTGHLRQLCIQGHMPGSQKVGNTWVIPRASVETYKPGPQGFAAVWGQRRAEEAAKRADDEALVKAALEEARKGRENEG